MINEKKYDLIKFEDGEFSLDVNVSPSEDTVWLTQTQIAELYNVDRSRITRHINNILNENELYTNSNVRKTHFANSDKPVYIYNLDMILAVGYRVNSKRGIMFRRWATQVLKQLQSKVQHLTNEIDLINDKISPLSDSSYFNTKLILNDEIYEAISFLKQLFNKAINRLIIIDSYINVETLDLLIDIKIPITIYTLPSANITNRDINSFNLDHHLNIIKSSKIHDRFIIIDDDLYSIGSSLKDCGKKLTTINKLETINIDDIINSL